MARSPAKKRATAKWDKENMFVFSCKIRKSKAIKFKEVCKMSGDTPNAIFAQAIDAYLREHGETLADPADPPADPPADDTET